VAGWAFAALQVIRGLTTRFDGAAVRAHLLPVAWIGGLFLWQGMQYVQSMRYLLPIYPMLAIMAASLLWWLVDWPEHGVTPASQIRARSPRTLRRRQSRPSKHPQRIWARRPETIARPDLSALTTLSTRCHAFARAFATMLLPWRTA